MRIVAIGLVAGLFSALFGVGGGLIVVPLLMLACAYPVRSATATSLAAIGVTALAGAVTYVLHDKVHAGYAVLVGLPAAVGAVTGATAAQRLTSRALTLSFALLLAALGAWLLAG